MGKQFTAAAVMLLVEDGRLRLDDKITKYFASAPAHWQKITIRHLLTHTSGTTDYPPSFNFRQDFTEDQLLEQAAVIPLAFQPGERWSYSNLGYVMLGGRTEEDGVYSYRRYRLVGNGGPRWCRVLLTSDDKIARLDLLPE